MEIFMNKEDTFIPTQLTAKASEELEEGVKRDLEEEKTPEEARAAVKKALEDLNTHKSGQCCGSGRCHD